MTFPDDYIRLINTFFDFSAKEIEILSELIRQNPKVVTKDSRLAVCDKLGLSNVFLNTYIKRIKDKEGIAANGNELRIDPVLVPEGNGLIFKWDDRKV